MKRISFILACILLSVVSCEKPEGEGKKASQVLVYASCKMAVKPGESKKKGLDIIGDSIAVHRLSRYMSYYSQYVINCGLGDFIDTYQTQGTFCDYVPTFYSRDTLEHTFSFSNNEVVDWFVKEPVDPDDFYNNDLVGVDGTEYLGSIICSENLIFSAMYDSTGKYFDPLSGEDAWHKFMGFCFHPDWIDTLGYIPNNQMRANRDHLQRLLDERKYQEMLDYFKTAYTIYTCTGEEYRELVRLGLN